MTWKFRMYFPCSLELCYIAFLLLFSEMHLTIVHAVSYTASIRELFSDENLPHTDENLYIKSVKKKNHLCSSLLHNFQRIEKKKGIETIFDKKKRKDIAMQRPSGMHVN